MLSGSLLLLRQFHPTPLIHAGTSMTGSRKWQSTLFVRDVEEFHTVQNHNTDIHVGIWWQSEQKIVGFGQLLTATTKTVQLVDSSLGHADIWDLARRLLSCPSGVEYFSIPRGRVLWHRVRDLGIIYHGNATPAGVLPKLARLFGLPKWEAHQDSHYLVGDALEAFYSLE